jgi:CRP/FNR family transcriptional regulator, dissimilatory nitrate respiration regulator
MQALGGCISMEDQFYSLAVFHKLPKDNISALFKVSQIHKYEAEEVIYRQGIHLEGIYIVLAGHVKLCRHSDKHSQILALLRLGDSFGIESLSDTATAAYGAESIDGAKLLFIPQNAVLELLEDYPHFRLFTIQLATERLRQFASLVHDLAFQDVASRLATLLVRRAETEGVARHDGIHFPTLMSQSEIAAMTGTGREVVQRTFKKFELLQLALVSRKETIILDLEKLRQIAQEENR